MNVGKYFWSQSFFDIEAQPKHGMIVFYPFCSTINVKEYIEKVDQIPDGTKFSKLKPNQ